MEPANAIRSVAPLRAIDLIGLLRQLGLVKTKGADENIESILGSVFGDDPPETW